MSRNETDDPTYYLLKALDWLTITSVRKLERDLHLASQVNASFFSIGVFMNFIKTVFSATAILSSVTLNFGCSEARDKDKSTQEAPQGAAGTLSGKIGSNDFKFVRGLAYVSSSKPSEVVVDLYDSRGPLDCEVRAEGVWHHYISQEETESDHVTIRIPSKQYNSSLKWSSLDPNDIRVFDSLTGNGAGTSVPVKKSVVGVEFMNANGISGFIDATTQDNSDVLNGSFTASFCKGSKF
ncbi:MAG: hypothetical protein NT027_14030 [Proteobacteria bacterium]|nr:hypothetical protein [Pseudomonadota bacterium]